MNNFGIIEGIALSIAMLWSIPWKGIALWKTAREGKKPWFIAFLLVNTFGILEILYIFVISKKKETKKTPVIKNAENAENKEEA